MHKDIVVTAGHKRHLRLLL